MKKITTTIAAVAVAAGALFAAAPANAASNVSFNQAYSIVKNQDRAAINKVTKGTFKKLASTNCEVLRAGYDVEDILVDAAEFTIEEGMDPTRGNGADFITVVNASIWVGVKSMCTDQQYKIDRFIGVNA